MNKAITSLRKSQKEALMIEEVEEYQSLENSSVNISELSVDRVKYAMMDLPKGFRSVLSLYLFEGYDHKEISEILGITESTSKSQYKRAKDKLKQILQKEVNYG